MTTRIVGKRWIRIKQSPTLVKNTQLNLNPEELWEFYQLTRENRLREIAFYHNHGAQANRYNFPEVLSENLVRLVIHYHLGDITATRNTKSGDVWCVTLGKVEAKCITSTGPISFTPKLQDAWNVLFLVDATLWIDNIFRVYKIDIASSDNAWKHIKVNADQTFEDQASQGRRPRAILTLLRKQIPEHKWTNVYEGGIDGIANKGTSLSAMS